MSWYPLRRARLSPTLARSWPPPARKPEWSWSRDGPLAWNPPYLGSQRSLVPDMILELEQTSFIIDAKYKRHWEELQEGAWHNQSVALHERHRADLLQALAYANLARTADVVCCLVYPCSQTTWESLAKRDRLFHQ